MFRRCLCAHAVNGTGIATESPATPEPPGLRGGRKNEKVVTQYKVADSIVDIQQDRSGRMAGDGRDGLRRGYLCGAVERPCRATTDAIR